MAVQAARKGTGTLKVSIGSLTEYTLQCHPVPDGSYNEIAIASPKPRVLIKAEITGSVRWSLAVGWKAGIDKQP
ncbi:hypothetical protein ACIQOU_35330 [Streptomyces sp. NPDC091279]|uniref:hypothetical protein n=1 Tax=unclassified Streptomyces TaxID=2593676 RepID=UPI0038261082